MTNAEQVLWHYLRRKQILGVQFYRQRPIGRFIVDFYAHQVKLVVEVDGSHHFQEDIKQKDAERTKILEQLGIRVMRFTNLEVLKELEAVVQNIYFVVTERLRNSPN
jgi:very-short-patch-repair endonuclease